jgi:hypothetical protein
MFLGMSAILLIFASVLTGCSSAPKLGPAQTSTITKVDDVSWEEEEWDKYYMYLDDNFQMVKTYSPGHYDSNGNYVKHNEWKEKTGRMIQRRRVTVVLSDGTSFEATSDQLRTYDFQEGKTAVYQKDKKGNVYLQSVTNP